MFDAKSRNYRILRKIAFSRGLALFGVADMKGLKDNINLASREAAKKLDFGISLGCVLSGPILEDIKDGPTQIYYFHYRRVNGFLDDIALSITTTIEKNGYRAFPVAASQVLDWQRQAGLITHKLVAERAGLGWVGRNNLLVNKKYGSQIRLASVLTDMPLKIDAPTRENCGRCYICLKSCPVSAIKATQEGFDRDACYAQLDEFKRIRNIGQHICGLCVKACAGKR